VVGIVVFIGIRKPELPGRRQIYFLTWLREKCDNYYVGPGS
jgi:hypothetical protein